jgi:hypothetical protein
MFTRKVLAGVRAVVAAVGLFFSHRYAFDKGERDLARRTDGMQDALDRARIAHIWYILEMLQLVARHPDAVPAEDAERLCGEVEGFAKFVEDKLIPPMREVGDERAQRYLKDVREARALTAQIRRYWAGHGRKLGRRGAATNLGGEPVQTNDPSKRDFAETTHARRSRDAGEQARSLQARGGKRAAGFIPAGIKPAARRPLPLFRGVV